MTAEVVIQNLTDKVNFINNEVERTGNNPADLIVCIDAEVLVHALGLINRLQSENKGKTEHLEKCLDEIDRLKTAYAEQKAKIERLTEWKDKLQDTKDELEQQLIDTGFKEYLEENKRLTAESAELQKQVDELKADITKVVENYKKEMPKVLEEVEKKIEEMQQQTVKDTAKECYEKMLEDCPIICDEEHTYSEFVKSYESWLKERYGVEVE